MAWENAKVGNSFPLPAALIIPPPRKAGSAVWAGRPVLPAAAREQPASSGDANVEPQEGESHVAGTGMARPVTREVMSSKPRRSATSSYPLSSLALRDA